MDTLEIIKVGGNIIDNPAVYNEFVKAFAKRSGKKILVHGGGKIATRLAEKMGVQTQMIEGRRVTDKDSLDIVTMVYSGLISKQLVAQLQALDCNAIGLCGADGNLIQATKRPAQPIDYGFVGDIKDNSVNTQFLANLLESGVYPVINAINHNGEGQLLNTNADTIASSIATAMSEKYKIKLSLIFDKSGVLFDINDEDSIIEEINSSNFSKLKEDGVIHQGMIPKIENALKATNAGVDSVVLSNPAYIIDENQKHTLITR